MNSLIIRGGNRLEGEIEVQGAKNSVLPILAATILNGGKNVIHNCPKLRDVEITIEVLRNLGCRIKQENKVLVVESDDITGYTR